MLVADPHADLGLLRHPLRREILQLFAEKDEPFTPDRAAKELGVRLNNLSYHVRVLVAAGALILIDEVPVRGALQHVYVVNHDQVTRVPWMREALGLPKLPDEDEPGDGE